MANSAKLSETLQPATVPEIKGVIGDSRTVAIGTLLSRITGFGRLATAAAVLGPTFFGNLFQTAAILPSSLYGLLIGVMVSAVLVPPLVQRKDNSGLGEVRRLAGAVLGALLIFLLLVGVVGVLATPVLLRGMTVTVTDPQIRRQQLMVGGPLIVLLMPQIVLYGIAGVGTAVQQAYGRFALPAIAPALENVVNIIVLGTSAFLFGVGNDVDRIGLPQLLLLGLGTTAAVAAHAGAQWIGAWRVGVPLIPRLRWRDPELREILRRGASSTGYSGLYYVGYWTVMVVAGTVPGGVAAFQMASAFCMLPTALTALPLGAAQLPRLSTRYDRQEMQAFGKVYESGLRLLVFMIVPAAMTAVAFPRILAGAGAFGAMSSPSGIALITACLGGLAFGMIGEATFLFTSSACYALGDTSGPLRAMSMRLALTVTFAAVVSLAIPAYHEMMWMLGGSLAAANLVAGAYLCRRLRSNFPSGVVKNSGLGGALIASGVAVIPALLLSSQLDTSTHLIGYQRLGWALAVAGMTMAVYLVIQFVRGSRELSLVLPVLGRCWTVRPRTAGM